MALVFVDVALLNKCSLLLDARSVYRQHGTHVSQVKSSSAFGAVRVAVASLGSSAVTCALLVQIIVVY